MYDFHEIRKAVSHGGCAGGLTARLVALLELLLADAASDVEVVARDLGLKDEMRERLRRALDRVGCAQEVLGAMREVGMGRSGRSEQLEQSARVTEEVSAEGSCPSGGGDTGRSDDHRRDDTLDVMERVRGAVELLAGGWPQHYPEGALEWRIFDKLERPALRHRATLR